MLRIESISDSYAEFIAAFMVCQSQYLATWALKQVKGDYGFKMRNER